MDDLDRMFRRLVQNIRNGYPEYLSQPFEVSELYTSLIPYRHNRRELEIETNEDYEIALCMLLAGERSLLGGDDMMRETIKLELAGPNPNTAIYREFASSRVALAAEAVRRVDPATTAQQGAPATRIPGASHATRPAASPSLMQAPPPGSRSSGRIERPGAPPAGAAPPPPRASAGAPAAAQATPTQCRFCGGALPSGRKVVFCAYCGQNLAQMRCPACGSELEIDWKFCVTCGRTASPT